MKLCALQVNRRFWTRLLVVTLYIEMFANYSRSQWEVVILSPNSQDNFFCYGTSGTNQVGYRYGIETAPGHALLWNGISASMIDLNPSGYGRSVAYATSGTTQVGYGVKVNSSIDRALLWYGSAGSFVDMHPEGFSRSYAYGAYGPTQVGWGNGTPTGNRDHALMWSGSAETVIDLTPAEYSETKAHGVFENKQVGYGRGATTGWYFHALLWTSSAAGVMDLHPVGFTQTYAYGISGTNQVGEGYGIATGYRNHALLWSGFPTSVVDLHPSNYMESYAYAVSGGLQVGRASGSITSGNSHAMLWSGSAGSAVDLHSFLPAGFHDSAARSVWTDANTVIVVGQGYNLISSRNEALMWVRQDSTPVQPTSYTILQGMNFGGNLGSLVNSDDNKVFVLCDEFESNGEIQFDSTLPAGTVNQLKFKFEGSATRTDLVQFVRMFNFSTNAYTNVNVQNATIADSVVEGTITSGVANYYSGSREVRSRVLWIPQTDIDAADGWVQTCDQVLWTMN